jgi:antitoxin VapB
MQNSRHVFLLTNGQDQVLTIPREFALLGTEVLLRSELIPPSSLLSLLTTDEKTLLCGAG